MPTETHLTNDVLDADEGLSMLLGGLSVSALSIAEWDECSDDSDDPGEEDSDLPRVGGVDDGTVEGMGVATKPTSLSTQRIPNDSSTPTTRHSKSPRLLLPDPSNSDPDAMFRHCYERAFQLTSDGRCCHPPVRIVDMSHINNRGFALVSTRPIRRGENIFTERAVEACQIPIRCDICRHSKESMVPGNEDSGTSESETEMEPENMYRVRGCQHCFKSLEPASSVLCHQSSPRPSPSQNAMSAKDEHPIQYQTLPMAHLWPVPEYDVDSKNPNGDVAREVDREGENPVVDRRTGRVRCRKCHATFCSNQCCDAHRKLMGDCCVYTSAVQNFAHDTCCSEGSETAEDKDGEIDVQPPLVLATRMFCAEIQRHRLYRGNGQVREDVFHGLCGDAQDVTPLELGVVCRDSPFSDSDINEHDAFSYTLEGAHAALCDAFSLTPVERRNVFPLSLLHRLAAVAARNGFHVTTQSPFRTYYSGLLRASGGRGSERHKNVVKDLAFALGSPDGELQRDMDREIEEKCAVNIAAIFTLTARINHSCDPCAEIRGGEFVDCHVDLHALREIESGEELTISYVNLGKNAGRAATDRNMRRRELKARYLFECDCHRCQDVDS